MLLMRKFLLLYWFKIGAAIFPLEVLIRGISGLYDIWCFFDESLGADINLLNPYGSWDKGFLLGFEGLELKGEGFLLLNSKFSP